MNIRIHRSDRSYKYAVVAEKPSISFYQNDIFNAHFDLLNFTLKSRARWNNNDKYHFLENHLESSPL